MVPEVVKKLETSRNTLFSRNQPVEIAKENVFINSI